MDFPRVSAVIPSYNHGSYVADAVLSVLRQTCGPVEIVVVDDGSADDTRDRLRQFGSAIHYVRQENRGLSAARNTGIRVAGGDWIAFLDADDVWHPQKLEVQFRSAATLGSVDVFGSPPVASMPDHLPTLSPAYLVGVRDLLSRTPITGSSTVVRRACFDRVGVFDESLRCAEDRDMWLRLATVAPMAVVESPCWLYRSHSAQMSRNPEQMYAGLRMVIVKFLNAHPEHRGDAKLAWGFLHLDAALSFITAGRRREALFHVTRSLLHYPFPARFGDVRFLRARLLTRLVLGDLAYSNLSRWAKTLAEGARVVHPPTHQSP